MLSHPLSLPKGEGQGEGLKEDFLHLLQNPNNASKEPIFIHFDKSVIGNTILEPGEADAAVIAPLQDKNDWTGVALACGGPIHEDPYPQAFDAASQAIRKVIAVGASPRALTDCLNYGNPENPEQLWQLAEGVRGLKESADAFFLPFISGNVSLYNCADDGSSIPPTATVCCVGILPDARKAISMNFKNVDSHIAIIRDDDLCHLMTIFPRIAQNDIVLSAHAISTDLMLSLLEMSATQRGSTTLIGCTIELDPNKGVPSSGILIETKKPTSHPDVLPIGHTTSHPMFIVRKGPNTLLSLPLPPLHNTWKNGILKTILASK